MAYYVDTQGKSIFEVGKNVFLTRNHELDNLLDTIDNKNRSVPLDEIQLHSDEFFDIEPDTLQMLINELNETVPLKDQNGLYDDFEKSCSYETPSKLVLESISRLSTSSTMLGDLFKDKDVLVNEQLVSVLNMAQENMDLAMILAKQCLGDPMPKQKAFENLECMNSQLDEVPKRKICHFTYEQKLVLNEFWEKCKFPSPKDYEDLAKLINVSKEKVIVHFKNRRQRTNYKRLANGNT